MSKHAILFEAPFAVSFQRHRETSVQSTGTYEFCAATNSVPITVAEFDQGCMNLPIVFVTDGTDVTPVAILGLRDKQNLFLQDDGTWVPETYIPAFVRRYPFVFSPSGDRFLLCLDEGYRGVNTEGRGFRLFTDDGQPTEQVNHALRFLSEFQSHFRVAQALGARLKELDLLEPMQANFTLPQAATLTLNGFLTVSRDKLAVLPSDVLGQLAQAGYLEAIYLHLHSLSQFARLRDRLVAREGLNGADDAADTAEAAVEQEAAD